MGSLGYLGWVLPYHVKCHRKSHDKEGGFIPSDLTKALRLVKYLAGQGPDHFG